MFAVLHKRFPGFWKIAFGIALGLLLLTGLPGPFSPGAASAETGGWAGAGTGAGGQEDFILEITGEGVAKPLAFTLADLEKMEQYQQVYSTINTWPTKRWYIARGVKLRELLARAGIKKEAKTINFIGIDGYGMTLMVKELLEDKRYYFPGLKENHPTDGSIPGSTKDKLEVEPVVAQVYAEDSDDPEDMNDPYGLMLIIGQRAVTEQTWLLFVKDLKKIEVLLDAPEKWDAPKVNIPDGATLPAGTELKLENKNTDSDKIYYTTDGSEPTVNSPIFNWSARRWWEQREDVDNINIPLEIVKEMINESFAGQDIVVLKLKTIGPGKEDSEVATYTFRIDPDADDPTKIPGGPATGITLDRRALDLPPGHAFKLDATVEPFNALDQNVIWRTSDTAVATVDTRGLVTVVGPGTAVITVETVDGNFRAFCVINGTEGEGEGEEEEDEGENFDPAAAVDGNTPPAEGNHDGYADQLLETGQSLGEEAPPAAVSTAAPEPAMPGTSSALQVDLNKAEPAAKAGRNSPPARDDLPEIPEGNWRYLAKKEDLATNPKNDHAAQIQDPFSQMQVFELSLDAAIPLSLPERQKNLERYMAAIFLFFLFLGASKRYIEYTKEL